MNESDYVCLCTVALFPQISPSSPAVTGSHLLTCTSGAFHHKIYFNFHIFIRCIQTVLCWPIREKASLCSVWNDLVRSRRSVWIHWTVYITTCISCIWTFTVCVHEYVCILCTTVWECNNNIQIMSCCADYVDWLWGWRGHFADWRVKVECNHAASVCPVCVCCCCSETNAEFSEQLIMFSIWSSHSLLINWPIYP